MRLVDYSDSDEGEEGMEESSRVEETREGRKRQLEEGAPERRPSVTSVAPAETTVAKRPCTATASPDRTIAKFQPASELLGGTRVAGSQPKASATMPRARPIFVPPQVRRGRPNVATADIEGMFSARASVHKKDQMR